MSTGGRLQRSHRGSGGFRSLSSMSLWREGSDYGLGLSKIEGSSLHGEAYLFMRTKNKDAAIEDETTGAASSTLATGATPPSTAVTESPTAALPIIAQPLTAVDPIPAEQQRELFKWMLEEKRKIKTKDPEEKKKIDEEKAILKQFIRAKSIPSI
ncbi:hypothetical protein Cgig2_028718 [Carnegiea gigantea]|uniref:Uncharacterized protein n=1 Tax=Carnegiea gigantea TaxID=171969 RepID=A0A9Q1KCV7_9CARY|nr:hypothetical protein Cgig2_028718 [Carnegiea gigantea]